MPIFDLYQISQRRSSGLTARIKPRAALRHRDHGCHHRHCHHHHNRNHHSILLMTLIILGRKYKKRVTIRGIKTQQHEWCHLFHPFPGQPAPPHPPSWLVLCIIASISVIINFNIAEPFTLYLSSSYPSPYTAINQHYCHINLVIKLANIVKIVRSPKPTQLCSQTIFDRMSIFQKPQ